eukprot:1185426-Prorocentrum_minimum.AAC.4
MALGLRGFRLSGVLALGFYGVRTSGDFGGLGRPTIKPSSPKLRAGFGVGRSLQGVGAAAASNPKPLNLYTPEALKPLTPGSIQGGPFFEEAGGGASGVQP